MKIFFIGQKGLPAKLGGVERHAEELAARLALSDQEVFVYTRPSYSDKNIRKYKNINLISLPSIPTKHLDAASHVILACLDLIRRKPDIIHFHGIGPALFLPLVKLIKPRTPIIFTFHCKDYEHQKWNFLAKSFLKLGEKISIKLADQVIVVSKDLQEYVRSKYRVEVELIYNGVGEVERLPASQIKKWGLEENNYLLAVSRFVPHKGLHYLIEAFNQIKTNKKLVITGDGAYTDDYVLRLKKIAANNPNIIFTGSQHGEVLAELFSNTYLFIQPSEAEGLSIALLEAFAYRKAVLASDIQANKECIGDIGFRFKNADIEDLKNKLNYLLAIPELVEQRGLAGADYVRIKHNWNDAIKILLKIYSQDIKTYVKK